MSAQETRRAAWSAMLAEMRAQYAGATPKTTLIVAALDSATTIMSTVTENTITAQQVTDMNTALTAISNNLTLPLAAIAAYPTLISTYNAAICAE